MDPGFCAQDVIRCDNCQTPVPTLHCELCHLNLCKKLDCVGKHKEHRVVPFEERGSTIKYPNCNTHSPKRCELYCKQCDIPICAQCVSHTEHFGHIVLEFTDILKDKKESIKNDLKEIEKSIYPKYLKAASIIPVQKADASEHSHRLKTALKEQGRLLYKEIDSIIQNMKSKIDDMGIKHLTAIVKQEDAINHAITEIEQTILELRKLQVTNDVNLVFEYRSRNEEMRNLPAQFQVTLPNFTPKEMNRNQIQQQIGFLSDLTIKGHNQDEPLKAQPVMSYPPAKQDNDKVAIPTKDPGDPIKTPGSVSSLLTKPQIISEINTDFGESKRLLNVSCPSDSEVWTSGKDNILRLYNLQGELLKYGQTRSGNWPSNIAVIKSGDLVYSDRNGRSLNIVKNTHIELLVRLRGWSPLYVCGTSSTDLLVIMISDDEKQCKVVRFSDSTAAQSIQRDDQGRPLYSSTNDAKYLSENKNLDICVADYSGEAVVVVSAAGKLRYRYTGSPSAARRSFHPCGITTDSRGRILVSEYRYHSVHIVDQNGQFLRYMDNLGLKHPWGLCVDSRDNLFVAELKTGKVKKIQYYE